MIRSSRPYPFKYFKGSTIFTCSILEFFVPNNIIEKENVHLDQTNAMIKGIYFLMIHLSFIGKDSPGDLSKLITTRRDGSLVSH